MRSRRVGTAWVQRRGKNWLSLSRKRRQTKPLGFLLHYFGTRRSMVQIHSPDHFTRNTRHRLRMTATRNSSVQHRSRAYAKEDFLSSDPVFSVATLFRPEKK